jgi:hypothetical protein
MLKIKLLVSVLVMTIGAYLHIKGFVHVIKTGEHVNLMVPFLMFISPLVVFYINHFIKVMKGVATEQ